MSETTGGHAKQHIEKLMASLSISKVPAVPAPNIEPGTIGNQVTIQSNAFGIIVEKETVVFMYDLRIYSEITPGKYVEFTKKGKDDSLVNERKQKSVTVLNHVLEKYKEFFGDKYKIYYDGQSILFALDDLFKKGGGDQNFKQFLVPGAELPGDLATLPSVIVEVKAAVDGTFLVNPDTIAMQTSSRDLSDRSRVISQFLEVVINEYAVMNPNRHKVFEYGKTFMTNPLNEGFTERDCPNVGDGKVLMVGTQKSVKQIEGPHGRGTTNPALIIDAKKAAFHVEMNCADKFIQIIGGNLIDRLSVTQAEKITGVMKGLFVETLHLRKNKRMPIVKVSQASALSTTFESADKEKMTVAEYFFKKYDITLKYPNAPLIVVTEKGRNNCYPAELCKVVPYQRVTIPQQTPQQSKLSTKECAVPPMTRQIAIMKGATALEVLNINNPYIRNAGIKLCTAPMKASARVLPSPGVLYKGGSQTVDSGKWRTRSTQYFMPATCKIWAAYLLQDETRRFSQNDFTTFVKRFYSECGKKGMDLGNGPTEIQLVARNTEIRDRLKFAAKHGCRFALIVASDTIDSIHPNMKFWEQETNIVTQHIKASNMNNIMANNKFLTLENIINKTNVKLGGLNYILDIRGLNGVAVKWFTEQRLIIGASLSHPPPSAKFENNGDAPTVVGYAANVKNNPYEYVGDYIFQDSRCGDSLDSMNLVVDAAVEHHMRYHNNRAATEVIIYRAGIDEGSYASIISRDIPLIRGILEKRGANPKLVFIVCQKEHNMRLFRENIDARRPPPEQNIPAGIVVDKEIAHPNYKEFYLNSHTTLQGSARTPRYTVLIDDINMSMDELEGMTFALAHNHQIVALTTSLPAPLYIAQRYAERGRMVYAEHLEDTGSSSGSSSGRWDDLNKALAYAGTPLAEARVNA